jgi:hypothetical protein
MKPQQNIIFIDMNILIMFRPTGYYAPQYGIFNTLLSCAYILSHVRVSVTNISGFWIALMDT